MPASRAWVESWNRTSRPLKRMTPRPAGSTPERIFMSVDLPAPFSPTRAWTSPLRRSNETWSSAFTPGKLLETPSTSRMTSCMRGNLLSAHEGMARGRTQSRMRHKTLDFRHCSEHHGEVLPSLFSFLSSATRRKVVMMAAPRSDIGFAYHTPSSPTKRGRMMRSGTTRMS